MVAKTEKIACKFVGDFEVADNIVRNANALTELATNNKSGALNKLMVIQAAAIVEVCLAQIIYRAQNFNREGVPNISEDDRKAIADTTVEKFNNIVQTMQKYKILDAMGREIYDDLHVLRKYRNKIHIQDRLDIEGASRNEDAAFSTKVVNWALDFSVRLLKHLNEKYSRPKELEPYAREITLPNSI